MSRAMAGIDVGKGQLDVSVYEGRVFRPTATLAQDQDRSRLPELLGRREQLVDQRTQEKNRLSQAASPSIDTATHPVAG